MIIQIFFSNRVIGGKIEIMVNCPKVCACRGLLCSSLGANSSDGKEESDSLELRVARELSVAKKSRLCLTLALGLVQCRSSRW